MIILRRQDGSKVAPVVGSDPSTLLLGRERGLHTRDPSVSRDHLFLKLDPLRPSSLSFEVTGRSPLWVLTRRSGWVRVYRSSDKGRVGVGDGLCFSGKEPFWFFLEEGSQAAKGRETENEMDERLEVDVSAIDPAKVGHEFDSYPKHMLREVKDWDWFLEEPSKEWDESDEANARRRKKAKDGMVENGEDEKALQKASKANKGVYWTRSRDPVKPTKKVSSGGASSSVGKKRADHVGVQTMRTKKMITKHWVASSWTTLNQKRRSMIARTRKMNFSMNKVIVRPQAMNATGFKMKNRHPCQCFLSPVAERTFFGQRELTRDLKLSDSRFHVHKSSVSRVVVGVLEQRLYFIHPHPTSSSAAADHVAPSSWTQSSSFPLVPVGIVGSLIWL